MLLTRFRFPGGRLQTLSAVVHFGGARDVTVHGLHVERIYPADAATDELFMALAEPRSRRSARPAQRIGTSSVTLNRALFLDDRCVATAETGIVRGPRQHRARSVMGTGGPARDIFLC
jgi:hypothetical protein